MPSTDRLYYHDSHLIEFDARVVAVNERDDGKLAVTLDRTAFYPTGGGQPTDTGTLNDAHVVDCIDAEVDGVLHVIQGLVPEIGDAVHGTVDWPRRLDHIQQHTGQHILSQAFVKLFDAPTHGFRMMENECEVDVALEDPTDERIEQAVDLANQIIWENRPITIRDVTSEEAASLPLRKESAREGELRLIEIDDFDLTPCGGTHAKSTGEVGVIAVRSWERAKGLTRIQFMAGIRALADYRKANHTARDIAELFSAGRDDSPQLVSKIIEENKKLARRVRELGEVACRVEAEELLRAATRYRTASGSERIIDSTLSNRGSSPTVREGSRYRTANGSERVPLTQGSDITSGDSTRYRTASGSERGSSPTVREGVSSQPGPRIITKLFPDRDADSLKQLALALIAHPNVIALLGSRDGDTARLVFARSSDAEGDMNTLMHEACPIIAGRGGGKPDMAQGGGKNIEKLADAIESATSSLGARTSRPQ